MVGLGLYLLILDYQIKSKFEAHRWNLPSRVYSDSYSLYPGKSISLVDVSRKLQRLHYKKASGSIKAPGEFQLGNAEVTIFLHNFSYPSGDFTGFPVRIEFENNTILRIQNLETHLETHEDIKTLKLEPELIGSIFDDKMEDRTLVTLTEIPDELSQAVIAVEDERFFSHHGIDPISIARALLVDLLHFKAVQGGSTLTQQLVKNYFLHSRKTLIRKFNEVWMAVLLEIHYTKEEILEAYLNEIYFGQKGPISVTGVAEAARMYFSKEVSQLSLSESALLAGMIRSPGEYSPYKNPERSQERRNLVLRLMKEQVLIDSGDYEKARKEKIILATSRHKVVQAPFFIDFVQAQLKADYPNSILKSEGMRIFTTLDLEAQEIAEIVLENHLSKLEKEKLKLKKNLESGKNLEGVFLAVQPQTGAIRAFVGGRNFEKSQFDRVTQAHRQPGSAFKPFVYLTALAQESGDKKYTLASTIEDKKFTVSSGTLTSKNWTPENYDKVEHGTVTLRRALEESMNIATSRLGLDVGLDPVVEMARAAGIESPMEPYPALCLGSFEVTPLELIRAYTLFPNQGTRSDPISITNVVTRDGVVLEKKSFQIKKIISNELAYLMNSLLRGVMDHEKGTAASARTMGFTGLAAGKTGTTSDYRDSWFVGYTPDVLALTWVGYDDNSPTGLSGASGALPIWTEFMKRINSVGAQKEDFPRPENIIIVNDELFIRGTEPHE